MRVAGVWERGNRLLEELAEQSSGRNGNRARDAKAIGFLIRQVHHHLESVRRLRLSLKVGERGRKAGFFNLDFHKEPGPAGSAHQSSRRSSCLMTAASVRPEGWWTARGAGR